MKKLMLIGCLLLLIPSVCIAEPQYKVGVHGALSFGGDVENPEFGFGAQAELGINDWFGVRLDVSKFGDGVSDHHIDLDLDLITVGLSAVLKSNAYENMVFYALAGLNYNFVDLDLSTDVGGVSLDADVDDKLGAHFGFGMEYLVHENISLFAEYRYTFLKLEGELKGRNFWGPISEDISGHYDFGLVKAGINFLF